jgi:septal ring factor EnvC (AmiA/AmiB activator)
MMDGRQERRERQISRPCRLCRLCLVEVLLLSSVVSAQDLDRQIHASQARLDSIRKERAQLEAELARLRGRAHSISGELSNLERQKSATNRLVNELDRQIRNLGGSLDTATFDLALTEDALAEKRAVLQRRLADIYKRGTLWTFQVMISAESFGELVSRYKYLYLVSRQDQDLVRSVEELRKRIASQRHQLLRIHDELAARRDERSDELSRVVTLERQRDRSLRETRASEVAAAARLDSLTKDARRLNDVIAGLERARRAAAATAPAAAGPSTITPNDIGKLGWPADGDVIYHFGPYRLPNNTVVRHLGIGIRAVVGTPVRAVAAGVVRLAQPYGTYGPSVILDHGGGFYTLYLYLSDLGVQVGQRVAQGDVVGRSGGAGSDEGPHVEFQVREAAIALDPLNWLKNRR